MGDGANIENKMFVFTLLKDMILCLIYNMSKDTLDIVKLIEKNPLTRLSKVYQDKLTNKIKSEFTDSQQQLFVASFYCYLNNDCVTDFIIDLDDVWKWLGFSRKDHAKTLLKKYFNEKYDYEILLPQSREQNSGPQENRGGINKEQILMTVNTFKKFCMKAGTKKSDEIHDYYIKLEEIMHNVIDEQTTDLRKQISESNGNMLLKEAQHKKELKMKRHSTLIEMLKSKRCIYVGEIEENTFIKIGSSQEVDYRAGRLQKTYGEMIFLDVFECQYFRETELNILKDATIKKNLYKKSIKLDGSGQFEVVKLTKNFTYDNLITIVKKYVDNDSQMFMSPEQLFKLKEKELDKQMAEYNVLMAAMSNGKLMNNIDVQQMIIKKIGDIASQKTSDECGVKPKKRILNSSFKPKKQSKIIESESDTNDDKSDIAPKSSNNESHVNSDSESDKNSDSGTDKDSEPDTKSNEIEKVIAKVNKNVKPPQGRKIQKIDQNDITKVITVYESMMYLLRSPENSKLNRYGIQDAIAKNTIYQGYRWNFVEKNDNPNISKAKPTDTSKKEYGTDVILQLNSTKTTILASYCTKISLANELEITKRKLNKIIQEKLKFGNCYYVFHKDCPKELLKDFDCPTIRTIKTNKSKQIIQINPITKAEYVFNSFDEIQLKVGFKRQTIQKAIDTNTMYGGSIWKYCD